MKFAILTFGGVVLILLIVLIIGLFLPQKRILTKQTVFNAPIEKVYNTVINNYDWEYRTSLEKLEIIESNNGHEVWEETSNGYTIKFKTIEKKPYSFYSFEMESKQFTGYWFAEFEAVEKGKTRFSATESIEYKNPFIRTFAYTFMNLDKFMEIYQNDLRKKLKE